MRKNFVCWVCLPLVGWFGGGVPCTGELALVGTSLAAEQPDEEQPSRKKAKHLYFTYEVVAVTESDFTIERTTAGGKLIRATIARRRRPDIKVGDRVRYDKKRNRLGRTLPPEEQKQ